MNCTVFVSSSLYEKENLLALGMCPLDAILIHTSTMYNSCIKHKQVKNYHRQFTTSGQLDLLSQPGLAYSTAIVHNTNLVNTFTQDSRDDCIPQPVDMRLTFSRFAYFLDDERPEPSILLTLLSLNLLAEHL